MDIKLNTGTFHENNLIGFDFKGKAIREITDEDNNFWFVAKDICEALGLENTTIALYAIDQEDLTLLKLRAGTQIREMNIVNESGLYTLILRSNKPEARAFKRWITSEVIPLIRKTGSYGKARLDNESIALAVATAVKAAIEPIIQELQKMSIRRSYKRQAPQPKNIESQGNEIKFFLQEFLRDKPISKSKEDLRRGRIFYDKIYSAYYYRGKDFKTYLYSKIQSAFDAMEIYRNLRALNNYPKTIRTEKRNSVRAWVCPESLLKEREADLIDHREYVSPNLL